MMSAKKPSKQVKSDYVLNSFETVLSKNSMNINQLPDSILLNIFSRLQFIELCLCKRVCQQWRKIANDFTLKKIIILNFPILDRHFADIFEHHFTEHLEEFQLLNSLSISDLFDSGHSRFLPPTIFNFNSPAIPTRAFKIFTFQEKLFLQYLNTKCENIKKLILSSCSLLNVSIHDLPPSLTHLGFRDCVVHPSTFFSMKPCHATRNLTCLEFSDSNNCLTSADLHVMTAFKSLKALYFGGCFRIDTGGIESLIDILPKLEVLDVEGTDISNKGIHIILNNCINIRELFIANTKINGNALKDHRIEKLPFLSHLCIKHTCVSSDSLHAFLSRCPENCGIKLEHSLQTLCSNPICNPKNGINLMEKDFLMFSYLHRFIYSFFSDRPIVRIPILLNNKNSSADLFTCKHYLSHKCVSNSNT